MRTRFTRDDGMTLLEVVVAAAILFIIMTAVLGLIGRTMQMGAQAKEINVSNNAVNSYVEWVRSLPFDQVVNSGGSIEATTVISGDYTITIMPNVEDGENEALKNMTLSVTVTRPDGFSESFETDIVVRDRDQHLTDAARSPSTDPKVQFVAPTPPDGAVVWWEGGGSWWKNTAGVKTPLQFTIKVTPSTGRTIELVTIQAHESWALEDIFGNFSMWSEPTWTVLPSPFSWDLHQQTTIGEYQVEEGENDVWAWATDSAGARGPDMRVYVVDNLAPEMPASITYVPSGISGTVEWPASRDGNQYAHHYRVEMLRHEVYGTWPYWPVALDTTVNGTSIAAPTVPFARYVARVTAESPRGLDVGPTDYISLTTRPKITGAYSISGNNKRWDVTAVSLSCTPPAFPLDTTAPVKYQWYLVNGATETAITGATSAALTRTKDTVTDFPTTPLLGYRCKVTCTARGMYAPSGALTYTSNTVYPELPAGTNRAFAEGSW